jgi:hypothetical protein
VRLRGKPVRIPAIELFPQLLCGETSGADYLGSRGDKTGKDSMITTIDTDKPLPRDIVERALREASDEQWSSERGRRNAAARKTITGGRNGGRRKRVVEADTQQH